MLLNYLKVALRVLARQRLYSAINILSLAVGIAFCTLVLLHLKNEWSADRFHDRVDDIYRAYRIEQRADGSTKLSAGLSAPLGPVLENEMPTVERAVRMRRGQGQVRRAGDVSVEQVLFADPGFFEMFSFPLMAQTDDPLDAPDGVVVSSGIAQRFFGDGNPVGQGIDIRLSDELRTFTVTGVAEPIPTNSSITFDFVLPYMSWPGYETQAESWGGFNSAVYVVLKPGTAESTAQDQLDRLVQPYYGPMIADAQAAGWWTTGDDAFDLQLQPLRDVHFSTGFTNMVASTESTGSLYVLAGIGLVVLLLACFNFMTLAAGRASGRAREVGVRKTLGARRGQLTTQFFAEALLLSTLALVAGTALARLALPFFNNLLESDLAFSGVDPAFVFGLVALTALSGLLAGSYPAMVLARVKPVDVLKGPIRLRIGLSVTQLLVVVQFALSIGMIACMLVMYGQLDYVQSKDLGFEESGVVAVNLQSAQTDEDALLERFSQQLESESASFGVTAASYGFDGGWSRFPMTQEGRQVIVYSMRVDPEYLGVMGMHLSAGRNLSRDFETDDEQAVVVNEAFVRAFGWENPIGHMLPGFEEEGVTVVGVVADYHFESLRDDIAPVMLHMSPSMGTLNFALIRVPSDGLATSMQQIRNAWAAVAPDQPFDYEFLDTRLANQYQAERRWTTILQTSAAFALLIACLGLFGLAVLSVERRRKEIGVRKVLGASAPRLALLLSQDFARLVLIAFVVICPIAYVIMDKWLDGFAYRVTISPTHFVFAGATALFIALLTVSVQSVRAALSDPVESLRQEA